jgi:hypothetical protein
MSITQRERQPVAEIDTMFPDHWILIDQPEIDEWNSVVSGIVVFAHPEKREVHRKAGELRLNHAALRCTKKEPGRISRLFT